MKISKIKSVSYVKPETSNYVGGEEESLSANPVSLKKKKKDEEESNTTYLEPKNMIKTKKKADIDPLPQDTEQTAEDYLERARKDDHEGTIEAGLSKLQEESDTPYQNLEGQLRLTSNYLNLEGLFSDYWSN